MLAMATVLYQRHLLSRVNKLDWPITHRIDDVIVERTPERAKKNKRNIETGHGIWV